jgi:signal transduction histidine kinase
VAAEVALACGVGAASFALVGTTVAAAGGADLVVAGLAVVSIVGVVAIARFWGIAYAVPAAMAALVAYDWFYFPPTHPHALPNSADLVDLIVYLAAAALVGQLATYSIRRADASEVARSALADEQAALRRSNTASREELARLADEQAALRRVATLVAHESSPGEVFSAVAREVGQLLRVDATHMGCYKLDGTTVVVASWARTGDEMAHGTRLAVDGQSVSALVLRTGRPARMDSYDDASGSIAAILRELGIRSSVGGPIVVDGRLWGVIIASSKGDQPLPADTESRITAFTELVATAISNADARAEVKRLAEEQAALRRVATLVAQAVPPNELFDAVTEEVGRLLRTDLAGMIRYESDAAVTPVAAWAAVGEHPELPDRWSTEEGDPTTMIAETRRPARVDDWTDVPGPISAFIREIGISSSVGSPILVEGRLWGALAVHTRQPQPLPTDTESRLENFTELVAAAISNIQARADLAASRARIVAATDEERRRVVRDLHDGAQQRLVHTVITLKLARDALHRQKDRGPALVTEALDNAQQATNELRELAHGILPAVLTHGGLRAGVAALAARMPVPVDNRVAVDRLPDAVEATAYFVVAEALTNVAKHARAGRAEVMARIEDGTLAVHVRDDGVGGARRDGSGLVGLADRLAVLDGRLEVDSPPDGGTLVAAVIPLPAELTTSAPRGIADDQLAW